MKKKTFGLAPNLNKGFSDTINIVENNNKLYFNAVVPLDRIETDPENPRKLAISVAEVKSGHLIHDARIDLKKIELEKLTELAESLKASELINPIIVYKYQENYRIATGERRYLASILAGKMEIEARIFHIKPEPFELKLMQWYENTEREDLTLAERINNIKDIINAYLKKHPELSMTSTVIKEIMGLSKTQAKYYLSIINAPVDILDAIEVGQINSLDKATLILSCKVPSIRHVAIMACSKGASLKQLRDIIEGTVAAASAGIKKSAIDLGKTVYPHVVQTFIKAMIQTPEYEKYFDHFDGLDPQNNKDMSIAFKKLVKLIETEEACIEN